MLVLGALLVVEGSREEAGGIGGGGGVAAAGLLEQVLGFVWTASSPLCWACLSSCASQSSEKSEEEQEGEEDFLSHGADMLKQKCLEGQIES